MIKSGRVRLLVAAAAVVTAAALTACSSDNNGSNAGSGNKELAGDILVDGSSTVGPLTKAAASLYAEEQPKVNATVGISGTGGGFKKFCNGEIDISDASRPIKDEEKTACTGKSISYTELIVANDALTVAVNKDVDFTDCLTVAQLKKIWEPGSKVNNWNQVDAKFPSKPLKLFGAGTDSGTFDYFTEVINGKAKASRTDYSPSEDDNILVQGVAGTSGAMGYFGFTYFEENTDKLKALQVDGGAGCVGPSIETAQNNTYKPLSRPLFIYISKAASGKEHVRDFVDFYIENIDEVVKAAKFVPLTAAQKTTLKSEFEAFKA